MGKSAFVQKYCRGLFHEGVRKSTIVKPSHREVTLDNGFQFTLDFWDNVETLNLDFVQKQFYQNARACFIMVDLS